MDQESKRFEKLSLIDLHDMVIDPLRHSNSERVRALVELDRRKTRRQWAVVAISVLLGLVAIGVTLFTKFYPPR